METADGEWTTDWSWLAAQRERWLREVFGSGTVWPARLAANAQSNLAAFADYVATRAPQGGNPRPGAIGIAFFGPPGIPPPEILGAAFAESLTYSVLEREGRILRQRGPHLWLAARWWTLAATGPTSEWPNPMTGAHSGARSR